MLFSIGYQQNVLAKLVNNRIGQMVGKAHTDFHLVAVIHLENLILPTGDLACLELLFTVPLRQKRVADILHAVNAEGAKIALVSVSIKIIVSAVPEHGIRAYDITIAIF